MTRPLAAVLFAGAGGSSLGVEWAGYRVVGFDNWAPAVAIHQRASLRAADDHMQSMECHLHNLSDATGDDSVLRLTEGARLWWASPPCQPFSTAGSHKGFDDQRDGWPWTLRLVAKALPDVLIAENVPGLVNRRNLAGFCTHVLRPLEDMGYVTDWRILNCADFGVPQTRKRVFLIARRDDRWICWPESTHSRLGLGDTQPWVSMAEALGWGYVDKPIHTITRGSSSGGGFDLASSSDTRQEMRDAVGTERWAMRPVRGAGAIERHGARRDVPMTEPAPTVTSHPSRQRWVVDRRQGGAPLIDMETQPAPSITAGAFGKGQWTITRPSTTVQGDSRIAPPGHHDRQMNDAIKIEPFEAGILQGFPADYPWEAAPNRTAAFKAIGNAVPPVMAQLLAEANRPEAPL